MATNQQDVTPVTGGPPTFSSISAILENMRAAHKAHSHLKVLNPLLAHQRDELAIQKQHYGSPTAPSQSRSQHSSGTEDLHFQVRTDDEAMARDTGGSDSLKATLQEAANPQAKTIPAPAPASAPASAEVQDPAPSVQDVETAAKPASTNTNKADLRLKAKPLQLKRLHSKASSKNEGPDTPSQCLNGSQTHRFLHKARADLLKAELNIPWEFVQKSWNNTRAGWRKSARQAESLKVLLDCVHTLRGALKLPPAYATIQELRTVDAQIQCCKSEQASIEDYSALIYAVKGFTKVLKTGYEGSKEDQSHALDDVDMQIAEDELPITAISPNEEEECLARFALEVLKGVSLGGEAALRQCPLEAILQYSCTAAKYLRQLVDSEILDLENYIAKPDQNVWNCYQGALDRRSQLADKLL